MPRPSGTRHTPARASASAATPLTSRPHERARRRPIGAIWPLRDREGRRLARAVRAEQRVRPRPARAREVDAVQHVDAAVAGADAAQLEHRLAGVDRVVGPTRRLAAPSPCRGRRPAPRRRAWISAGVPRAMTRPKSSTWMCVARAPSRTACRARRAGRRARRRRARAAAGRARRSRPRRDPTTARRAAAPAARSRARGRARPGAPCRWAASRRVSSATSAMPTRSSSSSATSAGSYASLAQRRRISAATSTFSRAVRLPNTSSRWNVRAMPEPGPLVRRRRR